MVADCETWIQDVDFARTTEHKIRHAKFATADTLIAWVNKNPDRLSFECDVTISSTSAVNPTFSSFVPIWRLARLASECYAMPGTLESIFLKRKESAIGVSESIIIGRCVYVVGCSWVEKWLCTIYFSMYPVFPYPGSMVDIY